MSSVVSPLDPATFDPVQAGFFRFRRLGDTYLITNDFGRYHLLGEADFKKFVAGALDKAAPLYGRLAKDGFIRDHMDFDGLAFVWRNRNRLLWQGPSLHVVSVVELADPGSRRGYGQGMSLETARKVVERIFESPSPALIIELAGGEPLANWPAVKFIIEHACEKNRAARKDLGITLVSNLSLMDDQKLEFLLQSPVAIQTFLDGPANLHDRNRAYTGGSRHDAVARWLRAIRRKAGAKLRIEARPMITRFSLPRYREIVDVYASLGARGIFLGNLSTGDVARGSWSKIGYSAEEFLEFYRRAFDRILELNKRQVFVEQKARIFLMKILTDSAPETARARAAGGSGIGEIGYDFAGNIYACGDGLALARNGDESFKLGSVNGGTYRDTASHPAVKALAVASCLDNQPDCARCVYKPYHDVSPLQCYVEQGDIMGRMPTNSRCRVDKGIMDHLFDKLRDEKNEKIFRKWISLKDAG